jgi:hypothetical protein
VKPHDHTQTASVSQTVNYPRLERMSDDAKFILGFG